jgi:hypothetical protein
MEVAGDTRPINRSEYADFIRGLRKIGSTLPKQRAGTTGGSQSLFYMPQMGCRQPRMPSGTSLRCAARDGGANLPSAPCAHLTPPHGSCWPCGIRNDCLRVLRIFTELAFSSAIYRHLLGAAGEQEDPNEQRHLAAPWHLGQSG